jgi:hypothetical protein
MSSLDDGGPSGSMPRQKIGRPKAIQFTLNRFQPKRNDGIPLEVIEGYPWAIRIGWSLGVISRDPFD